VGEYQSYIKAMNVEDRSIRRENPDFLDHIDKMDLLLR